MLTEKEMEMRSTGIGASEAAALVGLDPYKTPMQLWLIKRGLVKGEESEPAEWGNRLEPMIAAKWAEVHNAALTKGTTTRHPAFPHVLATPDYLHSMARPEVGVLEVKAPGLRMAHQWGSKGDDIPPAYLVQVQLQLAVTMRPVWDLAALIGGQEYREYQGEADQELQAGLMDKIETFWRAHVESDIPPPLDASDDTRRWLISRFPKASRAMREATADEVTLARSYSALGSAIRGMEKQRAEIRATLMAAVGPNEGLMFDGGKVTWSERRPYVRPSVQIEASRTLYVRIKGADDGE